MKKLNLVSLTAIIALDCLGAGAAEPTKIIPVGNRPESVTKGFGGRYYVTVMMGQEEGDGVIRVIDGDIAKDFATGLDEPKGIGFTGGHLVTTDVNKVWKVDQGGNKSLLADEGSFPVPVSYLNDVAVAGGGRYVYVTDMGANTKMFGPDGLWPPGSPEATALPAIGRIFRINMADGEVNVFVNNSVDWPTPNGITVRRDGTVYFVDFFTGNLMEKGRFQPKIIRTGFRGGDGIEFDPKGNLYISSWTRGQVWLIEQNPTGHNPKVVISGLRSAADFYLDAPEKRLVIPDMIAGTIIYLPIEY
jgi:hypothetical protein